MESSSIESVFSVVDQLQSVTEKVQTKIVDISKKIHAFKRNPLLDIDSVYLPFQIALLTNEKSYYGEMRRLLEKQMYNDLGRIYGKVLMLITSLETLDIDNEEEKNNIIRGVRKALRTEKVSCAEVINLASCSGSNLELVKRFTDLFEVYIQKLETENRRENIHCATISLTLKMRKKHIEVEYQKYQEELNDLVAYFLKCSASISAQLEHQDLLAFLISREEGQDI